MSKRQHSRRSRVAEAPSKAKSSTHFFARELAGEEPPEAPRMLSYVEAAVRLRQFEPWVLLDESNLFAVDPAAGGARRYCSVLGQGGEIYRLVAYEGDTGFDLFERMHHGQLTNPVELYSVGCILYVDFVAFDELSPLDVQVLRQGGHQILGRSLWPRFRSIRPSSGDWYVNAEEAAVLGDCLLSCIIAAGETRMGRGAALWGNPTQVPLISVRMDPATGHSAPDIQKVNRPPARGAAARAELPEPPSLDAGRLATLRAQVKTRAVTWQLGHMMMPAPIGGEHERPMFAWMGLSADASTGKLQAPAMFHGALPDRAVPQLLADALLEGIEEQEGIPARIQVERAAYKTALIPMATALGIKVEYRRKLEGIDLARAAFVSREFADHLAELDELEGFNGGEDGPPLPPPRAKRS